MHADVRAAWDSIAPQYRSRNIPIVVYGRSLGTGLAVQLARDVNPDQLILVSSYTSLVAASLTVPADAATMTARAKALADAEQALAAARATTLAGLVRKILPGSDETKIRAVAASMETRATARAARPAQ